MENRRLGGRSQRRLALKLWRMLKWTVISFSIVGALTIVLFLALIAYLSATPVMIRRLLLLFVIAVATQRKDRYKSVRGLEQSSVIISPYK